MTDRVQPSNKSIRSPQQRPTPCPICGAMTETTILGDKKGWVCLAAGYAHYYEAEYAHLERWFTSGEGNLREPVIEAMTCAA